MALPTTNLTAHFDASVNTKLSKTFVGGGTGPAGDTPSDGQGVQGWDDEGDGSIASLCLRYAVGSNEPLWRSTTPLLNLPCIDFDGTNDGFETQNQTGSAAVTLASFITTSAFTVAGIIWPESITLTDSTKPYECHPVFGSDGSSGPDWGLSARDDSGTKKLRAWHRSGGSIVSGNEVAISTGAGWYFKWKLDSGNIKLKVVDSARNVSNATDTTAGDVQETDGKIFVGDRGNAFFWNGRIGEFAIYNAVTSGADDTDLDNYFLDKWFGAQIAIAVGAGALTLTGYTPAAVLSLAPDAGALTITGQVPRLSTGLMVEAGSLLLTGQTPTLTVAATSTFPAALLCA